MKKTITVWDFINEFKECNREDNFSKEGLRALFEYLEQLEFSCDMQIELDVIALCCDYSEIYIANIFALTSCESIEELCDNTQVIEIFGTDKIIYQNF